MKEPGIWAGRGAERLGLRGPVQRSQFVALLRNENPTTGKRLTARMSRSRQEDGETVSNRQVGYGLVFGVPKSRSIYLAITADQVVEDIARSAVDETMRAMEAEMQCKVRKGGVHEDRRTTMPPARSPFGLELNLGANLQKPSSRRIGHRLVNYIVSAVKWPVPYATKFKVFGAIDGHGFRSFRD